MTQTKSVLEAFKEHVPTDEDLVEWLALLTEHKASIRGCDVLAGVAAFAPWAPSKPKNQKTLDRHYSPSVFSTTIDPKGFTP